MSPMESGSKRANYWLDIAQFWMRVLGALQRVLAFVVFSIVHHYASQLLVWTTPKGWGRACDLAEGVSWCIFVAVYAYLGWDMLTVFMPRLKGKQRK